MRGSIPLVYRMKLPKHIGAELAHNPHALVYETVAQYLDHAEEDGESDFISGAEREKSLATGELWEFRWYPETPVGFCTRRASTLQALLAALAELPE